MNYSWVAMALFAGVSVIPSGWYVFLKLRNREDRWQAISVIFWAFFLVFWLIEGFEIPVSWYQPIYLPMSVAGPYLPLLFYLAFMRNRESSSSI